MIRMAFYLTLLFMLGVGSILLYGLFNRFRQNAKGLIPGALFALIIFGLLISSLVIGFSNRFALRHLDATGIVQIQVADQVIRDRKTIEQIVFALRETEGFLPNHDRRPDIPFVIEFQSGERTMMGITYKQTTTVSNGKLLEGVVISFWPDGGFNRGEGFCAPLLPVLRDLGIHLE